MRIYYRSESLCGDRKGDGDKMPLVLRMLCSFGDRPDPQPFSMDDINSVLFNKHHSIGCSIDAPLKHVGWQNESQWYELFEGEEVFLPKCIVFTNGEESYSIVVIGDEYELRAWHESATVNKEKHQFFSHGPLITTMENQMIVESFNTLLEHIKREDEFERLHPKFG